MARPAEPRRRDTAGLKPFPGNPAAKNKQTMTTLTQHELSSTSGGFEPLTMPPGQDTSSQLDTWQLELFLAQLADEQERAWLRSQRMAD